MRKNITFLLWVLLVVFVASCTDVYNEDDAEKEEEIVPPGETYTPENTYNLNVVYYVPSDVVEIEDWHYRLSGVTLHIQNYFYENFMRYRVDKKFGLEVNDVNPAFIRIHYIKSTYSHEDMQEQHINGMAQEVLNYFKQHPEAKQSDHYLVYLPEYEGCFIKHYYPSAKEGMAFCGVDNTRWQIRYFESGRARAAFLSDLGYVLKEFAKSCFLPESNCGEDTPYRALLGAEVSLGPLGTYRNLPYFNCRNYAGYAGSSAGNYTVGTPDKVRLMVWDVRYLSGIQLFNDNYSYEPFEVDIREVNILSKKGVEFTEEDTLHVTCRFSTSEELAGVVLMDDPWRTWANNRWTPALDEDETYESGWDAYSLYVEQGMFEKEGDVYTVHFVIPMANHLNMALNASSTSFTLNHEIRFRFIGKNGMAYPHAPVSLKGGACESPMRNIYTVKNHPDKITGHYIHDIATRYGTWVGENEEE